MFWKLIARLLARPAVADWLIRRAMRTPYSPIIKSGKLYMNRWWLFNPYPDTGGADRPRWQFPISIRIHHIILPDQDRDMHDHPWNARTVILRGWYIEMREGEMIWEDRFIERCKGQTATLAYNEYHKITRVARSGAWTMFITGPYRGVWGFLVDGVKVKWRDYLDLNK